jgi:DNA invertase Pin-like site-specific DNA recombinase
MNAVMYLRVSSAGQSDGDGFPRQADAIQRYADCHKLAIATCFFEAISGADDDRPAFVAMLDYCVEVGVKTILIERMDRWARKFSTGESLIEDCRQRGLTVVNCATGDNLTDDTPDPDVWFIGALSLLMAEWDKRKLSHRMSVAKTRLRKANGKCDGRKGYRDDPNFPQGPAIIELARQLRKSGMPYREVAATLERNNLPTMNGGRWQPNTVRKMLARTH